MNVFVFIDLGNGNAKAIIFKFSLKQCKNSIGFRLAGAQR